MIQNNKSWSRIIEESDDGSWVLIEAEYPFEMDFSEIKWVESMPWNQYSSEQRNNFYLSRLESRYYHLYYYFFSKDLGRRNLK
jgi:hypothetical protein